MPRIADDLWKQADANAAARAEKQRKQAELQKRAEDLLKEAGSLDELLKKLGCGEGTEIIFISTRGGK